MSPYIIDCWRVRRAALSAFVLSGLLHSAPASAFRDDELNAEAAAAYRERVVQSAVGGAAQANQEAKRLEALEPTLTNSQRRDLQRCLANGMVYVSPTVGCQRDLESRW